MLKKIILKAEQGLIQQATLVAQHRQTTLESEFQQWLNHYITQNQSVDNYTKLMNALSHIEVGRTFTRDELNER